MSRTIFNSIAGGVGAGIGTSYETLSSRDLAQGSYSHLENFNDPTQFGLFDPSKQAYGVGYLPVDVALSLSLESLEELAAEQTQIYRMMAEQKSVLNRLGGVSRAHADSMREVLPANIALESYTSTVTKTNYVMTQEALSGGMKLVAMAGVIAVLGGVYYVLKHIAKKGDDKPNVKLAVNAQRSLGAAVSATKNIRKLVSVSPEFAELEKALRQKELEGEALLESVKKSGVSMMGLLMLDHRYRLFSTHGAEMLKTAQSIDSFIRGTVMVNVKEILAKGEKSDDFDLTFPVGDIDFSVGKAMEDWMGQNNLPHVDAHNFEAVRRMIADNLYRTANEEEIAKHLGKDGLEASARKDVASFFPEQSVVNFSRARILLNDLADDLEKAAKELEGSKVAAHIVADLKEQLAKGKETIKITAEAFDLHDNEKAVYERVAKVKGQTVSQIFSIFRKEGSDVLDPAISERFDKVLKKSFDQVKNPDQAKKKVDPASINSVEELDKFMSDPEATLVF